MKKLNHFKHAVLVLCAMAMLLVMSMTASAAFEVTTTGVTYPTTYTAGSTFKPAGTVKANTSIAKAVFSIYKADRKTLVKKYIAYPKTKTYYLSNAVNKLPFETLTAGDYYYIVSVFDSAGTKNRIADKKFTVKAATVSTITKKGVNFPTSIQKGNDFTIKGTLTSSQPMKSIVFTIYNSAGTTCLKRYSAAINSTSYSLSKANPYIDFSVLNAGTYYYRVCVYDYNSKKVRIANNKFTVTAPSSIKISGPVPSADFKIKYGSQYGISGTITSALPLKSVTAEIIYTKTGAKPYTKTVTTTASTYSVAGSALDAALHFEKLGVGPYKYVLSAIDSQGTKAVLVNRVFYVQATGSKIEATGTVNPKKGTTVTLSKGSVYELSGLIKSTYPLTNVTAKLTDKSGNVYYSSTETPNKYYYNMYDSNIDRKFAFDKLGVGTYIFTVTATDDRGSIEEVYKTTFIVK